MMGIDHVLLGLAMVFGLYMAWNIGANDVANAMGTSVGSKALTLKQAIIVAAIFEFCGAYFAGSHVTETVRKGMFDPMMFSGDIYILIYGMLAALIAAGVWLQIATYFGMPVSTTHSIVGAIIGFVLVAMGSTAVNWTKVSEIVASWAVSPLMSGTIAFMIFTIIRKKIFFAKNPLKASKQAAPFFIFMVFAVITLVMVFKGLKNLKLDFEFTEALMLAGALGLLAAAIGAIIINKFMNLGAEDVKKKLEENPIHEEEVMNELSRVPTLLNNITGDSDELLKQRVKKLELEVKKLIDDVKDGALSHYQRFQRQAGYINSEKIFAKLQILSASFIAFAHGSNDVANAIGPIAAVVTVIQTGSVAATVEVPPWILALGGFGIVVGLATWGYKVIYTIGKKITDLSPSRGFAAEFAAAITIVIASKFALPISTTHTLVGAVLGVGLAQGVNSLNLRVLRDIFTSWFVTLPVSAILSIMFFYILRLIFS